MTEMTEDRYGLGNVAVHRTLEEENAAKALCFKVCSVGGYLDWMAGCCSVCTSVDQCMGWVPHLSDVRASKVKA